MRMGKKFELEHWYAMLKDQSKWKKVCDPTETGSGSDQAQKGLTPTVLRTVTNWRVGVKGLKGGRLQRERANRRQATLLWRW